MRPAPYDGCGRGANRATESDGMERVVVRNDGQVQPDRLHRRRVRRPDQGPEPRHRLHQRARDRHQPHGQGEADRTGVPPGHVPLFHHVLSQGRGILRQRHPLEIPDPQLVLCAVHLPTCQRRGQLPVEHGHELQPLRLRPAQQAMSTSSSRPPTPTDRSYASPAHTTTMVPTPRVRCSPTKP